MMQPALLKKLSFRFGLLKAYTSPTRNFTFSVPDLIGGLVRPPCGRIAPRFIERVDDLEGGAFLRVKIKSVNTPLYWPRNLPLFDLHKVITECFSTSDWHFYEIEETRVSPGDVVLDCGAAEGVFSLRVLDRAGHIVAFEPQPTFIDSLRKTFEKFQHVSVAPFALGSVEDNAFLRGDSLHGVVTRESEGSIPIQITTIDNWATRTGRRVDFIKGDLESFEFDVLKGAKATITRYAPKIAITVYHPGNDWREIADYLRALVPKYVFRIKGLSFNDGAARPVMLHCWVP